MFDVDAFVARGHEKIIAYYTWLRDTADGRGAGAFRNASTSKAMLCGGILSGARGICRGPRSGPVTGGRLLSDVRPARPSQQHRAVWQTARDPLSDLERDFIQRRVERRDGCCKALFPFTLTASHGLLREATM